MQKSTQQNRAPIIQGRKVRKRSIKSLVSEVLGRQIPANDLLPIMDRAREIGKDEPWLKDMCTGGLKAHIFLAVVEFKREEEGIQTAGSQSSRKRKESYLSFDQIEWKEFRKTKRKRRTNRSQRRVRRKRQASRSVKRGDMA